MHTPALSDLFFKKLPLFFSVVLHPLLMPTIGVYVILHSGTNLSLMPEAGKNLILTVVASCTFGLPLAFLPFYHYRKITQSVQMEDRRERFIPLLITSSLYYLTYILLRRWGAPYLIQSFLLASALAVFATMLVSTRWKISAHMIGIGGIIGLILIMAIFYHADLMFFLMLSVLLAGTIGFSRLSLNAHTPGQVYSGLLVGITVMVGTIVGGYFW